MQEITLPISKLFSYLSDKYGLSFPYDVLVDAPFEISIRDEFNNLVPVSKLIKKRAKTHKLSFDDGTFLIAADDHALSVEPEHELSRLVKDWKPGYDFSYVSKVLVSNEELSEDDVYSVQVESPTHLFKTADGLVHHNTYSVTEAVRQSITKKGKLKYESGDMGAAPSAMLAFFFHYRNGKIIVLDDNDSMLKTTDQRAANILKAVLDPSAMTKPVSVPTTMMNSINNQIEALEESDALEESGPVICVDMPRLREGILSVSVGGRECAYEHISLREAQELEEVLTLREGWADDDLLTGEDEEEEAPRTEREEMDAMSDEGSGGGASDPVTRKFVFNSSVIFVSNLRKDQINSAVLDRVRAIEVNLELPEFMDRLGKIAAHLCKNSEFNSTPQEYVDWAKKCCFTTLKGVVACWEDGAPLFNTPIVINRKLTFRAFEEFVDTWMELAYDYEERQGGGSLSDKAFRDKISKHLVGDVIRRSILPWLREPERAR
jgi:hypothetical protein